MSTPKHARTYDKHGALPDWDRGVMLRRPACDAQGFRIIGHAVLEYISPEGAIIRAPRTYADAQ